MPELPEVETVRRSLEPILGLRVSNTRVLTRRVIATPRDPAAGFARARSHTTPSRLRKAELLHGATITRAIRHGKQLALLADHGAALCVHLGMTGQLAITKPGARLPDHTHATWTLTNGSASPAARLLFRDPRRFGGLWLFPSEADLRATRWSKLGPDALTLTSAQLAAACRNTSRDIKGVLLDQSRLAGVGNIYADEALHRAGVHPSATASSLRPGQLRALARAIRSTLSRAIRARGSTLRDYRDASGAPGGAQRGHRVYGRAGLPCLACGGALRAATIAQRTTVWCPNCQPIRARGSR